MLPVRTRVLALSIALAVALAAGGIWAVVRYEEHRGSPVERTVDRVRDATPRLLPTKIPVGWKATATASSSFYTVTYEARSGTPWVRLTVAVPDPPLPTAATMRRTMPFRTDRAAAYQVAGDERSLRWWEPGTWDSHVVGARHDAVPYELTAHGMDEDQFLAIARSLREVG